MMCDYVMLYPVEPLLHTVRRDVELGAKETIGDGGDEDGEICGTEQEAQTERNARMWI